MIEYLTAFADEQIQRVRASDSSAMLSDRAFSTVKTSLEEIIGTVTKSTMNKMLADEITPANPLAALSLDLALKEEREKAERTINSRLTSGESALPFPLVNTLRSRLSAAGDAIIEMLERVTVHRAEICHALTGRKLFTRIEDLTLFAGDTHAHGRSVMILDTDAGKLVYKPRDLRGEAFVQALAERFFGDTVGIPRCVAFGDSFGVCELIEKRRSVGEAAAKRFYRRMGAAAAFIKIIGSTDMHVENITCTDDRPYIIDLETILSPEMENTDYARLHPELSVLKSRSPYLSGLLPSEHDGRQFSVLMNTEDDGCAPEVGGRRVPVTGYFDAFKAGYHEAYSQVLKRRGEISAFIRERSGAFPVRLLIRSTQYYHDTILKLYHHNALASEEKQAQTNELLSRIMHSKIRPEFVGAVESELRQMMRGDIPYVYTYANSRDLYSDGRIAAKNVFRNTAAEHALANIAAMDEADEAFDLGLMERAVMQYPKALPEDERETPVILERTDTPMTREQTLAEAKELFYRIAALALQSPGGKLFWGFLNESDYGFRFCEAGLSNGLAGNAVFTSAYAFVSGEERAEAFAGKAVDELVSELDRMYGWLEDKAFAPRYAPSLGESEGIGGILTALALIRRYTGREELASLQKKTLFTLHQQDLSKYGAPDRMTGMSGLLSALCRFEEYRDTALIRKAADSLIAMKTLDHRGGKLWKSFPDKNRPISGGGHGLAGIAEALCAAASILGDSRYSGAAADALAFELEAYSEKFGTWADLRTVPPVGYMHGYCSGAPGIGMMCERIRRDGSDSSALQKCAALAEKSVDELPMNERDHLCCGNSAVVEYYLTVGRHDEAGKVLGAMKERKDRSGEYRYMGYHYHNSVTASLFYGAGGIGYELLRYAAPGKIISVL